MSPPRLVKDLRDQELLSRFMSSVEDARALTGGVFVFRYEQMSAQVKDLDNLAQSLSGEAGDEGAVATSMLRDISWLEQDLPSGLKVGAPRFTLALRRQAASPVSFCMSRTAWTPWPPR